MRKFEIGDRVTVREFQDLEEEFGIITKNSLYFTESMKRYCGRSFEIYAVYTNMVGGLSYRIKSRQEYNLEFMWVAEMFVESNPLAEKLTIAIYGQQAKTIEEIPG